MTTITDVAQAVGYFSDLAVLDRIRMRWQDLEIPVVAREPDGYRRPVWEMLRSCFDVDRAPQHDLFA